MRPQPLTFIVTIALAACVVCAQPAAKSAVRRRKTVPAKIALQRLDAAVRDRIAKAVDPIVLEAKELDDLKNPKATAVFRRPHPAVKDWQADMAMPALLRMNEDFTKGAGSRFRDTYVRWHLIHTVKQLDQAQLTEASPYLGELMDAIPGPLRTSYVVEYKREPQENYDEWYRVYTSPTLRITVGYPPFQQLVDVPESLKYMNEKQLAKAQPMWAKAQALKKTYKEKYSPIARSFNDRIAEMNVIAREYQGEVVYELLRTGDPNRFKDVIRAIDKHARKKDSITGFDMLGYVYLAGFDGHLDQYDVDVRKQMGKALEKTARATQDQWVRHGVFKRNFADYAFHMIETLQHGDDFKLD